MFGLQQLSLRLFKFNVFNFNCYSVRAFTLIVDIMKRVRWDVPPPRIDDGGTQRRHWDVYTMLYFDGAIYSGGFAVLHILKLTHKTFSISNFRQPNPPDPYFHSGTYD